MSDSMTRLLAGLGYDANQLAEEVQRVELVIDRFDPWTNRQSLAITTTCGAALGVQASTLR